VACPKSRCGVVSGSRCSQSRQLVALPAPTCVAAEVLEPGPVVDSARRTGHGDVEGCAWPSVGEPDASVHAFDEAAGDVQT